MSNVERWVRAAASFLAPTTVLIGLLYYFGYVRSVALYNYFGVDPSTLGLSTQDYLLRSVDALYVPLGSLALLAIAGVWVWRGVDHQLRTHPDGLIVLIIGLVALLIGIGTLGGAIQGIISPNRPTPIRTPLLMIVSVLFIAGGSAVIVRRKRWNLGEVAQRLTIVLLVFVAILGIFWAANEYAQAYGRGRAQVLSSQLLTRPRVTLDTKERLYPDAPGVTETALSGGGSLLYRYRGYRLFAQSTTAIFLIPEGWTTDQGAILAAPNNDQVRIQYAP